MVDNTILRAYACAAGALKKQKNQGLQRSSGVF